MKDFEKKLTNLFDYQRFTKNKELQRLINDVNSRYETGAVLLNESDLSFVAGGRQLDQIKKKEKKK